MAFALAFDPDDARRHLSRADVRLKALVRRIGPCGIALQPAPSPFHALAEAITHQQLNGRAAATIFGRVRDLFPARRLTPGALQGLPDEALRQAGLSRAKLAAFRDLAARAEEGIVPSWAALKRLPDEAILERLTRVRGIGAWTVEMLLIFRLGRPDVWPVDDFAVRKAYGRLFDIEAPRPAEMRERAEAWRPYRSAAAWYLWRSLEP